MGWKEVVALFLVFIVIAFLAVYWFGPSLKQVEFDNGTKNANFSVTSLSTIGMQFYENMRYTDQKISYKISDCTLEKKARMEEAFSMVESRTSLEFYPVDSDEEITITCDEKQRLSGGMFIAGEGGPINITQAGDFNVILQGKVLLIRSSECPNPNVALHELLHALGFEHSSNTNNIMYNFSDCDQTMGDQIPDLINELYSIESYPDLVLEEVTPVMHGKYLDVNISVRNNGFQESLPTSIFIYADDEMIQEIELDSLGIGFGMKLMSVNILIKQISVDEFRFVIDSNVNELNYDNNELVFSVKN